MYKGEYIFISKLAIGKVLDVSQDHWNFGNLVLHDYHGGENQIFTISQYYAPFYIIRSLKSKDALTVEGNSSDNGKNIIEEEFRFEELQSQKFKIREMPNGEVVLYTFCGKVVDIANCSKKNNAEIIQWDFNGGDNQMWILRRPEYHT